MKDRYFQVITAESGGTPEILLYGVIGMDDFASPDEAITDVEFLKAFRALEMKHDRINIRINSPGGSMYHGNAIVTAIQESKAEIHTYNDGLAASMASTIFLVGDVRHASKNSLLLFISQVHLSCKG